MKLTFVALPNLTSHSTFHECSRGIFYQPQYSPHGNLTKLGVITLYFLRLERKIISPSTSIISLEHHNGIHTDEVDLLDFKEDNDLPSWYPIFQLPYQIDVKVTCTGVHVYVEIIYIDCHLTPTSLRLSFIAIQVTSSYGAYTASPAKKTTSAIIEVKIDKSLQFQVNQLNIARVTSITT